MKLKTSIIVIMVGATVTGLSVIALNVLIDLNLLQALDRISSSNLQYTHLQERLGEMRVGTHRVLVFSTVLGFLVAVAAIFVIVRLRRRIFQPLGILSEAVRSVGTGHLKPLELDDFGGELGELAVAFNEMTERLARTLDELQEGERRYRAIVQDQTDLIVRCLPDGTVTFANDAIARYMGQTVEEIVGAQIPPFISADEDVSVEQSLRELLGDRDVVTRESLAMVEGRGACWQIWTIRGISDADGAPREFQAVGRDVTEQKMAEKEHEELEGKFLQAQKMEAIGQLAGGVAHDFNNLLQVILGFSEIAILELGKDEKQREMMHEVLNAANRAKTLVGQLLAFSRRQVLTVVDIDVNEVIDGITKMIRRIIGEHIALEVVSGPGAMVVNVDRGQFEQVLMNLCVNARDAMTTGGTIRIQTRLIDISGTASGLEGELDAGEYVLLTVSDTGQGMDENTKSHIFEPFFTTKDSGEGTGLGLATVYGIVLQHHGFIDLDSTLGEGTTFRIYLPLSVANKSVKPAPATGELAGGHETILVVEDEEVVRVVAKRMLERAGYKVITAGNGDEALSIFERGEIPIQMLLCDVVMPGMSGPQTFVEIKKRHPQVRCLFATGYSSGGIYDGELVDETTEYVQKPYEMTVLLEKVRAVLDARE